ncbi:DNA repair protein RecO [bacterium]|nr:DNA repair protein RecO [bacterium]
MRVQKTQGIILQIYPRGEKDYSVTVFSPTLGRIRTYAKGARRIESKFTGHLDLLNVCDFELYEGPHSTLITQCNVIGSFPNFREELSKFYLATESAIMTNRCITENEDHMSSYRLLLETLEALNTFNKEDLIFEAFKIKLCEILGLMPNLYSLNQTEFHNLSLRLKKILKFMLEKPYCEIVNLSIPQKDSNNLKKTTEQFLAFI